MVYKSDTEGNWVSKAQIPQYLIDEYEQSIKEGGGKGPAVQKARAKLAAERQKKEEAEAARIAADRAANKQPKVAQRLQV